MPFFWKNQILIPFVSTLFTFFFTFGANAFFESSPNEELLFIFRPSHTPFHTKGSKKFVLCDNFRHRLGRYNQEQVIFPQSDHFAPMDIMDTDFPVYNILRHTISGEYSAANFIYANLRLEKLREEYDAVQKQARELLEGIDDPFDINFSSTNPNTENEVQGGENDASEASPEQSERAIPDKQQQQRKSKRIRQKGKSGGKKESVENKLSKLRRQSNSIARDAWTQDSKDKDESNSEVLLTQIRRDLQGIVQGIKETKDKEASPERTKSNIIDNSASAKLMSRDTKEDPLPLIFQVPWDIIQYLIANKLEAAIYGIILMFLIAVVTSIKPRDEGSVGLD